MVFKIKHEATINSSTKICQVCSSNMYVEHHNFKVELLVPESIKIYGLEHAEKEHNLKCTWGWKKSPETKAIMSSDHPLD